MKKLFFLLLFPLCGIGGLYATVTVTPLGVDYFTQKVTFKVEWTNSPIAPYNNRVWIWIDFCSITGTSPGAFTKAEISGATATAGSIDAATLNGRGFYITTNPSTVSATLSNAPTGKFNWCVYGSDAPPKVSANNGTYTLYGTPPFTLIAANGTTTQTVTATTIATSVVTITPVTLTDQTGCPGVFCIYTGSDMYIDGTHLCQQRASGAQNWEAWIKDTRDNELYRIVLMPDNKWWLAQNVKYASVGSAISNCTKDDCGLGYTHAQVYAQYAGGSSGSSGNVQGICPPGWLLPVYADFMAWINTIGSNEKICQYLRAEESQCVPRTNYYGFANVRCVYYATPDALGDGWYTTHEWREDGFIVDFRADGTGPLCNSLYQHTVTAVHSATVRCFRQL